MMKLSKSIPVLLTAAVALSSAAFAGDVSPTRILKSGHGALFELGTKKVAATFVSSSSGCDLIVMIADLPDADGNVSGLPTRMNVPLGAGTQTKVYLPEGYAMEASCALSAKIVTLRPLTFTAAVAR